MDWIVPQHHDARTEAISRVNSNIYSTNECLVRALVLVALCRS